MALQDEEDNMLRTLEFHRITLVLPQDRVKVNTYRVKADEGETILDSPSAIEMRRIWDYVTNNGTENTVE